MFMDEIVETLKKNGYRYDCSLYSSKEVNILKIIHNEHKDTFIAKVQCREYQNRAKREFDVLKKIDSKDIVKVFDYIEKEQFSIIILEYIEGTDLFNYILDNQLSYQKILTIIKVLVKNLQYLQKLDIHYMDIKLENVMINSNEEIKIIDFGIINNKDKGERKEGTIFYFSPEKKKGSFSVELDNCWAIGVVLFILIVKKYPFRENTIISNEQINYTLNIFRKHSEKYTDLLSKLFVIDSESRLTYSQIIEYINKV